MDEVSHIHQKIHSNDPHNLVYLDLFQHQLWDQQSVCLCAPWPSDMSRPVRRQQEKSITHYNYSMLECIKHRNKTTSCFTTVIGCNVVNAHAKSPDNHMRVT